MFPLIFQSLCAHKISFVQHDTWTHLYLVTACMQCLQKHFWKEYLCALQVFLCAFVSRLVCACTHAHSLKGTLLRSRDRPNFVYVFVFGPETADFAGSGLFLVL